MQTFVKSSHEHSNITNFEKNPTESGLDCHNVSRKIPSLAQPRFHLPVSNTSTASSKDQLKSALLERIKGVRKEGLDFNSLALRLFSYQYQHCPAYQNYCNAKGRTPDKVSHWHEIPTVPTDAFKLPHYPITSAATDTLEPIRHTFHTSGTTAEVKGHHHFPSLAFYELSIVEAWRQLQLPPLKADQTTIFLTPHPEDAPHSSLAHMMDVLATAVANERIYWGVHPDGSLRIDQIQSALSSQSPVAILGTALAYLHLFEQSPTPVHLPKGSWALETGGYKGTQRSLSKEELYRMFQQQLGLAPESVINEYSMTELSSQFYTNGIGRSHRGPNWTRIRVIDPITENEVPNGTPGHLAIYDLANLHSVIAIQTQDIAIAHDEHSFTLIGRDPAALPRGCSRASDSTMQVS